MKFFLLVTVVVFGFEAFVSSQAPKHHFTYTASMDDCISKAKQAVDPVDLSRRPASEINELDWQLSVCEANFAPTKPTGVSLIVVAHGTVADEYRERIVKAIGKLPQEGQAQVWEAFNADKGMQVAK